MSFKVMRCHSSTPETTVYDSPVILVGNPNVGKSVLFGALTGRYANVSNYPGTTVEITRGTLSLNGQPRPVIDTPGINSIIPFSDDERVTQDILLTQASSTIIQVVDMKNLQRGLLIALELAEAGLPFIINLNMADEAKARGIEVDTKQLSAKLGVPVISTVAVRGIGLAKLVEYLGSACPATFTITYDAVIEDALTRLAIYLPKMSVGSRSLALMLLAGDDDLLHRLLPAEREQSAVRIIRQETEQALGQPLAYTITCQRMNAVEAIIKDVVSYNRPSGKLFTETLGRWMVHPIGGWPILAAVLYLLFLFVGVLGAGFLVDVLETRLFGEIINPWLIWLVETLIPIPLLQEFLVGEYGLITMALTYSLAIVLPIVTTFFLAFSILEDSGYLSRLAVMLDRVFRLMGLNGKAVLPMILGLGCVTMATIATRILETRKERLQVTLLLALGVPCSAQLGVILGMITGLGVTAVVIWLAVVISTLLAVGYLAAQVIPGQQSDFILELPTIRMPSLSNIAIKTLARLEWYLKEVVPIFILGTTILFVLDKVKLLGLIERLLSPIIVTWLNLPVEVTGVFLIGFLRRDYGATGLFAMARDGMLTPLQIVISLVVITLFMPCVANVLMIVKEYGTRTALAVAAFVFPFAFLIGGLLNLVLQRLSIF
jgi:ferrous iron transport protein B